MCRRCNGEGRTKCFFYEKNFTVFYRARSRILEQNDAKDREKYVVKFIKIMKHLRKINNFNSYLALLSALDSAPVRRLEWQKHITEGLKEYCALIDSSSSFRAYRQALAETHPPCIPYMWVFQNRVSNTYDRVIELRQIKSPNIHPTPPRESNSWWYFSSAYSFR